MVENLLVADLTDYDRERYARQITIAGFGEESQRRLKNSAALVTRAGGLGGPVALYLAAAGIGKLVVLHGHNLALPDLNRQILMRDDCVGKPRAGQICETLTRFNPHVNLTVVDRDCTEVDVEPWVAEVDVVCDCPPTFEERFLLNRLAVKHRRPMIEAAMNGMEAHLTVIVPGQTPCLECIYPEPSQWWSETEFAVLGAVSGALGCLAAIEAIKVITGFGQPLAGSLLTFNTESQEYRKYRVRRRPDCPVCAEL